MTATALAVRAGFASSKNQAKSQLGGGQYKLDGETIDGKYAFEKLPPEAFATPRTLQIGKRKVIVKRA